MNVRGQIRPGDIVTPRGDYKRLQIWSHEISDSDPEETYPILAIGAQGDVFLVLSIKDTWALILVSEGKTGYVALDMLTRVTV